LIFVVVDHFSWNWFCLMLTFLFCSSPSLRLSLTCYSQDTFDGRSDYGPFLVAGIPAGGVDAGADKIKTEAERQRYQSITGWGGAANQINDQCYHRG